MSRIDENFADAPEIAESTGVTVRAVQLRASRNEWEGKQVRAKGGPKRLYRIDALPEEIKAAVLLRRHKQSPATSSTAGGSDEVRIDGQLPPAAPAAAASKRQGEAAAADYDPDALWENFRRLTRNQQEAAEERLKAVVAGLDLIDSGVSARRAWTTAGQMVRKGRSTVQKWHQALVDGGYHRSDWLPALAPQQRGGQNRADCDPEIWDLIANDYLRPSAPAASACIYRARQVAKKKGLTMPCDRTLQRWLGPPEKGGRIPEPVRILAREGAAALQRIYPHQRRDRRALRSMDLVNADGHKFDVMCRWPDGHVGRPIMLAWQDVYSGKLLDYEIGKAESGDLVRRSLGRMLTNIGIPDQVLFDNGRAFANKYLTGGTPTRFRGTILPDDPVGILTKLAVPVIWAEPGHGQSKPIERYFGDVAEHVSRHILCEGAYVGNSPDAKPSNYGERAMPIEVFEDLVAQQVAMLNAKPGRRGGVCNGRSFDQTFKDGLQNKALRRATAQQRHLWMLAAVGIKARKPTGEIHLAGNRYWDEALTPYMGQSLVVRFDQEDLHKGVIVETKDGRQICIAACIDDTGFIDQAAAKEHKKRLSAYKRKHRAALKELESAEAVKRLRRSPAPPEPDGPIDQKVVAPVFGKKVAGSDVNPGPDDLNDGYDEKLRAQVRRLRRAQDFE